MSYKNEPIAVVGTACRLPGGSDSPSKLWDLLKEPHDVSQKVPSSRFDIDSYYHPEATHHGTTNTTKSYFLDNDISNFDASFFNIQPVESESIDPQQRLLLETVYDSLSTAGIPLDELRGSQTAVYIGMMCDDWSTIVSRDLETLPTYAATGQARSIVSNRVSYFFDWHGPSMTIDTACSSSLVAVHQAVQTLRTGQSRVAVAAGTNLILSPVMYITESKLRMLSPTGRCAMWDSAADGYARGEGVVSVVLKTLRDAIADGDHIECIIRETGVNQDGRTPGLTMPSGVAQAALITQTYQRAGLNLDNLSDRPQFFHAHGTGTQAGDPQESEAISIALFPHGPVDGNKLLVGSIKTIIGHTEGSAGLASLLGTSLALQHSTIPPNLHFNNLSAKVAPFYDHLQIPTSAQSWPPLNPGQIRRASVNSFGFGGTNVHAIVEAYEPEQRVSSRTDILFTPLIFSAASEKALQKTLSTYQQYLRQNPAVDLPDLSWTLKARRSTFPYRKAIVGSTVKDLSQQLETILSTPKDADAGLGTRYSSNATASILGVFTGQGAQWARMGAVLIQSSEFARETITKLDQILQSIPNEVRPAWSLVEQLLNPDCKINDASLSQPLCTAVQILLVDIIAASGLKFKAVVGHSSGEIGCAYASGLLSAPDAIRIAYYRGFYAKLACSPRGHQGSMMAVAASYDEAVDVCGMENFRGRLQVAAVNSPSSITLSGDSDAIDEASLHFENQQKFARKLKVDTAYHSNHMAPCAKPYLEAMRTIKATFSESNGVHWFSSVHDRVRMSEAALSSDYWIENMCNPVMFSSALEHAVSECGSFDLVIEVGPHPALKGPALATIEKLGAPMPYTGLLSRGKDDTHQLSHAWGFIWTHLGPGNLNFATIHQLLSGNSNPRSVLSDLPSYPFDHHRSYWTGSRISNQYKHRVDPPNPLIGSLCIEGSTLQDSQWRNILRPNEVGWLQGHKLQGQIVFPATGYVSMAVEAIKSLAKTSDFSCFKITDVEINRAIVFDDHGSSVETLFCLSGVTITPYSIHADFACYSVSPGDATTTLHARGKASANLGTVIPELHPTTISPQFNLVEVDRDKFYGNLLSFGYNYSPPFQGILKIQRKPDYSTGFFEDQAGSELEDDLLVHPGMLDTALQTAFAAWSHPGDGRLWSLHVPTHISSVTINPHSGSHGQGKQKIIKYESFIRTEQTPSLSADIHLYSEDGSNTYVQIEGASLVPFSPASAINDTPLFSSFKCQVAHPNGELAGLGEGLSHADIQQYHDVDRLSFWFIRNVVAKFPSDQRETLLPHFKYYLRWCDRMVDMVTTGKHYKALPEYENDTWEHIATILSRYEGRKDFRFLQVVGEHLVQVISEGKSMLEYMVQDDNMLAFYENGLVAGPNNVWLSRILLQISHRYPHMNILEIGAGTGATTKGILSELKSSFSTFTFTDISAGFFPDAKELLKEYSSRMLYKTFDMEKSISEQGFTDGQYDIAVASNVLHVSANIEQSMANIRRLLKPGGYLVVLEVISTEDLMSGMAVGTLPGWWLAAENGRPWGPAFTLSQWDEVFRNTGFSGIDTTAPDISANLPVTVFVTQAIDPRISLLRDPLAFSITEDRSGDLVIIGGHTLPVRKLVQRSSSLLSHKFARVSIFKDLDTLSISDLSRNSGLSVLCLTDLDQPFMKDLNAEKFRALKKLWNCGRNIVWVTQGSKEDEPYSSIMVGVGRTMQAEYPTINLQLFDIDRICEGTARRLCEALFSNQHLISWAAPMSELLWSMEPEVFLKDEELFVPRLLPNYEKNNRYNSQRRTIYRDLCPRKDSIRLISVGNSYELLEVSPLRIHAAPTADCRTVRITHSLLHCLKVEGAGFLRLCAGVDNSSGDHLLAFSASPESPAIIPLEWCVPLPKNTDAAFLLVWIAVQVVVEHILDIVPEYASILVNDGHDILRLVLRTMADKKNITTVFTTTNEASAIDEVMHIHPSLTQHALTQRMPLHVSAFVDFAPTNTQGHMHNFIVRSLPSGLIDIPVSALFSHCMTIYPGPTNARPGAVLRHVVKSCLLDNVLPSPQPILLNDVADCSPDVHVLSVVDWTAVKIQAKVQPIDSDVLFKADKTYFIVGMAGQIGQSLAQWMVTHGARHIVLSSRAPKVASSFIESMAKHGAIIKVMSLDITSRKSLHDCFGTICRTMPVIAGVVNGAMILQDDLFENMDYEQFTKVLGPKVEGTKLLDELFHDTPLDFFIITSSINAVTGYPGQSNYSAANMFMASLMYQRKKRGVAGSAMDVSAIAGIGYAAAGHLNFETFGASGNIAMSEQDFSTLFAEAMLSGRPGTKEEAEIVSGIGYIAEDLHVNEAFRRDVKFCHYILDGDKGSGIVSKETVVRVRTELEEAENKVEVYNIIRDNFIAKFKKILQISEEETVNETVALVEQGVDSLVAVDIRSWFAKEIDVNIPVLKVLGGSSIVDLLEIALEEVPANIIPKAWEDKTEDNTLPLLQTSSEVTPSTFTPDLSSKAISNIDASDTSHSPLESHSSWERLSDGCCCSDDALVKSEGNMLNSSSCEAVSAMSFSQTRFWFLRQFLDDNTPFNISISARMSGHFQVERFESALRMVVRRHEALRTRFFWSEADVDTPLQGILPNATLKLEKRHISSESEADHELEDLRKHTYGIERWDTVRVILLTLSESVHYFLLGCHHIALDGQSIHILMSELDAAYRGQTFVDLQPSSQYSAFAAQQRLGYESGLLQKEISFFKKSIDKDPGAIQLFSFAKTTCRSALENYRLLEAVNRVDVQLVSKVKLLARKLHCTNFHVYLSILQALVSCLLPETDEFFVGIADSNRTDEKFTATLGCLVNLLPIKFTRKESKSFSETIKSTRNKVYGALEHSKLPFQVLLDELGIGRSSEYTPIFQIFMDYRQGEHAHERLSIAGCETDIAWSNASTGYDVQLEVLETSSGESIVALKVQDSLYTQSDADLLLSTYINILERFAESETGDIALDSTSLWCEADVASALVIGKGPSVELLWGPTVIHRLDDIIEAFPASIALKDGHGHVLTYAQMDNRVNAFAIMLLEHSVGDGSVVAVFQEPSADWMCSMLAIFRVGAIYVPLDMRNGIDRLKGSVNVAGPKLILTDDWTKDHVPSIEAQGSSIVNVSEIISDDHLSKAKVPNRAKASALAIILFTSGSTGVPKGIMLPHSCLVAHAEGVEQAWGVGPNVVLQQITLSFDFSLHQIFTAVLNGGTLCVVPSRSRGNPADITKIMLDEEVTHTLATPTEYSMWFNSGHDNLSKCSAWKWALVGGEALPKSIIRGFGELCLSSLKLYDFYGPVEATIAITKGEIDYRDHGFERLIATGHVLPNYSVYIMDENLKPLPVGVPGEIVAGGPCIASGYIGLDDLTQEKFINDVYQDQHAQSHGWDRLYRTGDRGRLSYNGELYYEGRIDGDTQIKLLGVRIELAEIESAIVDQAHGELNQTVVLLHGETDSKFLVAYVVFSDHCQTEADDQQSFLNCLTSSLPLPQFMRPAVYVPVVTIPTNPHGKIDRTALRMIPLPNSIPTEVIQGNVFSKTERRVLDLWISILPPRESPFLPDTDFFYAGGNSLLLVKLQRFLKDQFHAAPSLFELMNSSTIRKMAGLTLISGVGEAIDWKVETSIPDLWASITVEPKLPPKDNLTIVLTGATGYLGRHLLPRLVQNPRVSRILCLIRDEKRLDIMSSKVVAIVCNIAQPELGLSTAQFAGLSTQADAIVHLAANRSFWDDYEVLRPVNFTAVKELARMALLHRIPLHFFSSGAVKTYDGLHTPPSDGSDGYVASKWASEELLRNAAQQLALPVYIHTAQEAPEGTPCTQETAILQAFIDCSLRIGKRPSFEGISGYMDLIETSRFIDQICSSVIENSFPNSTNTIPSLFRVSYDSFVRVDVDFSTIVLQQSEPWKELPTVDILAWMGEVKKNGFPYVLSSQNITMSSELGQVVSRR